MLEPRAPGFVEDVGLWGLGFGASTFNGRQKRLLRMLKPNGPCTQLVHTLAPKYIGTTFQANLYTIWAHGFFGKECFSFEGCQAVSVSLWSSF